MQVTAYVGMGLGPNSSFLRLDKPARAHCGYIDIESGDCVPPPGSEQSYGRNRTLPRIETAGPVEPPGSARGRGPNRSHRTCSLPAVAAHPLPQVRRGLQRAVALAQLSLRCMLTCCS